MRCGARSPSSSLSPPPTRGPSVPGARCSLSAGPPATYTPPGWCTSSAPVPVNLHVCHESRVEALRRYALMFGIARQPGHVFFDPARDVLYFGPRDGFMAAEAQLRTVLVLADPDELARVRRVALSAAVLGDIFPATTGAVASSFSTSLAGTNLAVDVLHQLRTRMPHLQELMVVPRDENPVYSTNAMLVPLPLPLSLPLPPPLSLPLSRLPAESMSMMRPAPAAPLPSADEASALDFASAFAANIHWARAASWDHACSGTAASTDASTHAALIAAVASTSCLARQVHVAMRRVCAAAPEWTPPRWQILVISSGPALLDRPQMLREGGVGEDEREKIDRATRSTSSSGSGSNNKRQGKRRASRAKCGRDCARACHFRAPSPYYCRPSCQSIFCRDCQAASSPVLCKEARR